MVVADRCRCSAVAAPCTANPAFRRTRYRPAPRFDGNLAGVTDHSSDRIQVSLGKVTARIEKLFAASRGIAGRGEVPVGYAKRKSRPAQVDMRLTIRLDPARLRQWHVRLAARLARRANTRVAIEWSASGEELPTAVPLLFSLEKLIYRLPGDGLAAAASVGDFARFTTNARQ